MKRNTPNKRSESEMVEYFRSAYTPKKHEKQKINPIFLRLPYSACEVEGKEK